MCHLPLTPTHDQHFPPEGTFSPTGEPTLIDTSLLHDVLVLGGCSMCL